MRNYQVKCNEEIDIKELATKTTVARMKVLGHLYKPLVVFIRDTLRFR